MIRSVRIVLLLAIGSCLIQAPGIQAQESDQTNQHPQNLLQKLENSSGAQQASILMDLSEWYLTKDVNLSLRYASEAFDLAGSLELYSLVARSFFVFGKAYHVDNQLEAAEESLLEALELYTNQPDAIKEVADVYLELGSVYKHMSRYAHSMKIYESGYELADELNDTWLLATFLTRIANKYKHLGEYDPAIEFALRSIEIARENGHLDLLSLCYNELGHIYTKIEKFDEAAECFRLVVEVVGEPSNPRVIANSLEGLGEMAEEQNKHDSALIYYLQALDYRQQIFDPVTLHFTTINVSNAYLELEEFSRASDYLSRSLAIANEANIQSLRANTLLSFGTLEEKKGNYGQAIEYFLQALNINENTEARPQELSCLESIYLTYEKLGNINLSFEYLKRYQKLSGELFNEKSSSKIEEIRTRYRTKGMEAEIQLLEQEGIIKDLEVEKYRRRTMFAVILIILAVFIAAFGYFMWSQKEKVNKLMRQRNAELDRLNQKLTELNHTKDKFFSIVAHDLKGPISNMWGYAELLKSREKLDERKKRLYQEFIFESIHDVSELLENLLEWSRSQQKSMGFNQQELDLTKLIAGNVALIKSTAEKKQISIIAETEGPVMVYADNQMINSVLRNLINNAVKFTPEKGTLQISTSDDIRMVKVSVSDTGIGMNQETIDGLFKMDKTITTKGTSGESGTGLGLLICKDFVDHHGGSFHIESEPGKGSTFTFSIPKSESPEAKSDQSV